MQHFREAKGYLKALERKVSLPPDGRATVQWEEIDEAAALELTVNHDVVVFPRSKCALAMPSSLSSHGAFGVAPIQSGLQGISLAVLSRQIFLEDIRVAQAS